MSIMRYGSMLFVVSGISSTLGWMKPNVMQLTRIPSQRVYWLKQCHFTRLFTARSDFQ